MFQKSLQILIVTSLLALVAIVGYATLRLHGAEATIAEAEGMLSRGEAARAVGLLDLTAPTVERDVKLRERLWRLRYAANTALGNAPGALRDIDHLLRAGVEDDEALRLDQIRLLAIDGAATGNGDPAREAAQRFLVQHPGHERALELAGEACQTSYQPLMKAMVEHFDQELGKPERKRARDAMLAYLFRGDGDGEAARAAEDLRQLYVAAARRSAGWPPVWAKLQRLRERVQEGLGYFRQSLETGGEPVAAFRAVTLALEQGQRIDDLLLACEIQRRRFDHKYVVEAGASAAWALLREDQPAAALATADRWLPSDSIKQRHTAGTLGAAATSELILARGYAAWLLKDPIQLQRASIEAYQLSQLQQVTFANAFTAAVQQSMNPDQYRQTLDNTLRWAAGLALRPVPPGQLDMAPLLIGLQADRLRAANAGADEQQQPLSDWIEARPIDFEPRLAMARFLLDRGRTGAALAALQEAAEIDPQDDRPFQLRFATSRSHFKEAGQDGPGLLLQCQTRNALVPEVSDPIGYLLCAETAMEQKLWLVAIACTRAGVDAFPQARLPRLMEIRANLAAGRAEDAARHSLRLLDLLPPNAETTQLALEAHLAAGLPTRPLLAAAMAAGAPSTVLQTELLRHALSSGPALVDDFVMPLAAAADAPAELAVLATTALSRAGRTETTAGYLQRLMPNATGMAPALRSMLLGAYTEWLPAAAKNQLDAGFATAIQQRLARFWPMPAGAAPLLTTAAERLALTHPRSALVLLTTALDGCDAEDRNGALFALAGSMAARSGDWNTAYDHWTAASAFADSRGTAEDLARLCLGLGRDDRARQAFAVVANPTDPALALFCGQQMPALQRLAADLERDKADLLAHCVLALSGQPSLTDWQPLSGPAANERLQLVAILRDPALAPLALSRCQQLRAETPTSRTNRLLLARALVHSGQPQQASAIHAELHREGACDLVFWRDVALAAKVDGYVVDGALRQAIMDAGTRGALGNSPVAVSYALNSVAEVFHDAGHHDLADQVQLSMWLQVPRAKPLSNGDLERIVLGHKPADAYYILDQVLTGPYAGGPDFGPRVDRLHEIARRALAADPSLLPVLRTNTEEYLQRAGARGSLVHFLIDHADAGPPPHLDTKARAELLAAHLQFVAAGNEPATMLQSTVDALIAARGRDDVVRQIEQLRRQHPTTVALWQERARLSVDTPDARRLIAELGQALQHAEVPAAVVTYTALAATNRQINAKDLERFSRVPQAMHRSAEGTFAAAMAALRLGRADDALVLFANVGPRPDGMHLYGHALALLQSRRPDAPTAARQLLLQLARDYPNSSAARNAGSFANQLVPR
ncbi:MAG: hypothetical protein MUC36_10470 [Planctomycetes bacterium]|jgi:hypothetical protein|nr:hypothetical protein [Planctomycetota bacterium]